MAVGGQPPVSSTRPSMTIASPLTESIAGRHFHRLLRAVAEFTAQGYAPSVAACDAVALEAGPLAFEQRPGRAVRAMVRSDVALGDIGVAPRPKFLRVGCGAWRRHIGNGHIGIDIAVALAGDAIDKGLLLQGGVCRLSFSLVAQARGDARD